MTLKALNSDTDPSLMEGDDVVIRWMVLKRIAKGCQQTTDGLNRQARRTHARDSQIMRDSMEGALTAFAGFSMWDLEEPHIWGLLPSEGFLAVELHSLRMLTSLARRAQLS